MPLFRRPLPPALTCALLWGSAFPAIKHVYEFWETNELVSTLPLIFLFAGVRFMIAGGGLLFFGKNLRQELRATPWKFLTLLALTQTFIQYVFFYQSVAVSSASLTALLVATGSFWWMILAPLIQKTPWPKKRQWLGPKLLAQFPARQQSLLFREQMLRRHHPVTLQHQNHGCQTIDSQHRQNHLPTKLDRKQLKQAEKYPPIRNPIGYFLSLIASIPAPSCASDRSQIPRALFQVLKSIRTRIHEL